MRRFLIVVAITVVGLVGAIPALAQGGNCEAWRNSFAHKQYGTPSWQSAFERYADRGCPGVELALTVDESPDPAHVGDRVVYVFNVTNNGPDTVTDAVMTGELLGPLTLDFDVSYVIGGFCSLDDTSISCGFDPLAPGQSAIISLGYTVDATGLTSLSAEVTTSADDLFLENNSIEESTTLLP